MYCFKTFSQYISDLECLIIIDDNIIPDIREVYLRNASGEDIKLDYKTGRLKLAEKTKNEFCQISQEITLSINYLRSCPDNEQLIYHIKLDSKLLCQDYLVLRIYNFDLYKKGFYTKKGFGYEYESPLKSELLPKTYNKKILNRCRGNTPHR